MKAFILHSLDPEELTMDSLAQDEPTWRCQMNPFVGALGNQEPVILGQS